MAGKTLRGRFALLVALAALAAVLVPGGLAVGTEESPITGDPSLVFLQLGGVDQVVFEDDVQGIVGSNNCTAVSFAASPSLLSLNPSGGDLGFVKDSFGVRSNGDGNGEPCGRVEADDAEAISVTLGSDLSSYSMSAIDVDLELKFGAMIDVSFLHEGQMVATDTFDPATPSDDGPDSADGDNYRYFNRPGVLFDEVVFTPTSGSLSLEGGSDGTEDGSLAANNFSQFEVVKAFDGEITCGDVETIGDPESDPVFGDITVHSMDTEGSGQWLVEPDCILKPFNADVDVDSLAFVPELEGTQARYTIEVTAKDQAITVDENGQITSLEAVYNPEGDLSFPPETTRPLLACEGQPNLDIGSTAYVAFWTQTDVGLLPVGESSCFYSASVTPTGQDIGTESWGIYFEDDPSWAWR